MQAFFEANVPAVRYELVVASPVREVRSHQGLVLTSLAPLPDAGADDLIVVPGMRYGATLHPDRSAVKWLRTSAAAGARIASVCTGAFILGHAGLLEGRRSTTHWSRTTELQERFPGTRVQLNRLFVDDGPITTSAGIASGIDMALAMIERTEGPLVAAQIARELVVYLRRDGGHQQQSVYLDYRTHLHPGIHRVQDLLIQNMGEAPSISELAGKANMSPRNLTRQFRTATGVSIKEFSTRIRLELARTLLNDPDLTIEAIANRCGFGGGRQLRRVWSQAFGNQMRRAERQPQRH